MSKDQFAMDRTGNDLSETADSSRMCAIGAVWNEHTTYSEKQGVVFHVEITAVLALIAFLFPPSISFPILSSI